MLTNLYYYNYYRPYLIRPTGPGQSRRSISTREEIAPAKVVKDDYDVYLNKSLKKDVINYAKDIYTSITDLKVTSKNLLNDLHAYKRYGWHDGFNMAEFKGQFAENVSNYVQAYNSSSKFLDEQTHSSGLRHFADRIKTDTQRFSRTLNRAGILRNEEGLVVKEGEDVTKAFWRKTGLVKTSPVWSGI